MGRGGEGVTVVIDVGCANHGGDGSIAPLLAEYAPERLYGFDPEWAGDALSWREGGCDIEVRKAAAWKRGGTVDFVFAGLGGRVRAERDITKAKLVVAVDLAEFIHELSLFDDIVLKLDCEGAEYVLVPHLVATGADERLSLALIEWHCDVCLHGIWGGVHPETCKTDRQQWLDRRDRFARQLRCPVEEWRL